MRFQCIRVRTIKNAADITDAMYPRDNVEDTVRRSRSMSRSRTAVPNQDSSAALTSSQPQVKPSSSPQGTNTSPVRTTRSGTDTDASASAKRPELRENNTQDHFSKDCLLYIIRRNYFGPGSNCR